MRRNFGPLINSFFTFFIQIQTRTREQMLEAFNLFPQTRYLRVRKNAELDHKCGGFSSLLIILVLLVILIIKLIQSFSMTTFFFATETLVDVEPRMTTISTFQNDNSYAPYMITTGFRDGGCASTKTVKAYYYQITDLLSNTPNINATEIPLEKCTAEHFSVVPSLKQKILTVGISNVMCLPLNRTFEIGGSFELSNTWKGLLFQFNCTQSCGINNCGSITVNQLNSLLNPNTGNPFQYHLERNDMDFSDRTWNQYVSEIEQNFITTDQSLFPYSNMISQSSLSNKALKKRREIDFSSPTTTDLWIERSSITKNVDRRYLKLLDVLSYVGGIFPNLFTLFFFMKFFGIYFFEMAFAREQFRCHETKQYGFVHYLKKLVYKVFTRLGFNLKNWKIAKKQVQLNQLVNKMLDVNYLYRRIQFLERAISLLLDKHQLKGIYLTRNSMKDAGNQHKNLQLRDHLIKYLDKREREKRLKQIKETDKVLESKNKAEIQMSKDPNKGKQKAKIKGNTLSGTTQSQRAFMNKNKSQLTSEEKPENISQKKLSIEQELVRRQNKMQIANQSSMIRVFDNPDEEWISDEFEGDLKKLFKEANKKGDPTSKKILSNIDDWLRSELQFALDEYQKENPRFEYRLCSESEEK